MEETQTETKSLPTEVWMLVCEEFEIHRNFGVLFNCLFVNKILSGAAVKSLYRIHSHSPVITEGAEIELSRRATPADIKKHYARQVQEITKWALQWRSIIQSSLGKTAYPYCLYIKSLDLRNLSQLLENGIFQDNIQETFFTEDLCRVIKSNSFVQEKRFGKNSMKRRNLKYNANLCRVVIGETITSYIHENTEQLDTKSAIEEVAGEVPNDLLLSWCGRLAKLKTLTLWDGNSLSKSVAQQIRAKCGDFTSLSILSYLGPNADNNMADFFNNLKPNSLTYFNMIHSNDLHEETFKALSGSHSMSLAELRLASLKSNAIACLALLKECTKLVTLLLEDREGRLDLEITDKEACSAITSWLRSCHGLKALTIDTLRSGSHIVHPVLMDPNIKLEKFEMIKFVSEQVITVLNLQKELREVKLRGDPPTRSVLGPPFQALPMDTEIIECMAALPKLQILDLLGISDNFNDFEVRRLCRHLRGLRELSIGGDPITDNILPSLTNLAHLHSLHLTAITRFTFPALETYIKQLSPINNANFVLSVMSQALEYKIEETKLEILARELKERVGGRFEFVLFRESDDDFEGYETEMGD